MTMSLPYRREMIPRAKGMRKNATRQERWLWYEFLREYPIRFQRQKTIGSFIADFYCSKVRLAVELDGSQHYSEDGMAYDEERTAVLFGYGVTVLRFSNQDVDRNFSGVCEQIDCQMQRMLKETHPLAPSPRELSPQGD
ncbi:MAG: endonuclease domain-containing protein [Candidatus Onthomonas sp.]